MAREILARTFKHLAATILLTGVSNLCVSAQAAELKVISAGAVRGVLLGMMDDFTKQSGHTFSFTIGSTGRLREVITSDVNGGAKKCQMAA